MQWAHVVVHLLTISLRMEPTTELFIRVDQFIFIYLTGNTIEYTDALQ